MRRRRRLWLLAGLVGAAVVAIVVASTGGGSGSHPSFTPSGGGGPASVLPPPVANPSHVGRRPAAPPPFRPAAAAVKLADRLPLAQALAQLFLVTLDGTDSTAVAGLGHTGWGGVVLSSANFVSDGQIGALAGDVVNAAHAAGGVAPLIAATQEGGSDTAFSDLPPESEAEIGASGQPAVAAAQARLAGEKLRALGVEMTLAPLADVDTPGGALSGRLFSSNPSAVARFSVAAVDGYNAAGEIAAVGHFPGSGGASADPDQMTATVGGSLAELRSRDLIPFAAAVAKAAVIVMSNASYVAFDGVTPADLLPTAVSLLRDGLGFDGVVMSDDLDATLDATGSDPGTVAVQALKAGDDLLYISGPPSEHEAAYAAVLSAAERSAPVRQLVRRALLRDLTLKASYRVLR